jgi:hypothetical protein
VAPGIEPESVTRNSDHWTTEAVKNSIYIMKVIHTDFFHSSYSEYKISHSMQDPTCNGQLLGQHPEDWQLMTSSRN